VIKSDVKGQSEGGTHSKRLLYMAVLSSPCAVVTSCGLQDLEASSAARAIARSKGLSLNA
jgi:hypothetical protein